MNYRRLGGGVGVIKMTHCESHIWWTQEKNLAYAPLYLEEPWLRSFVQLEKTIEQILFFAGASTFRNTRLRTELTCKTPPLHNAFPLCAEEYLFLALIYHGVLMGIFVFVLLVWVLWAFVVIIVVLFLIFFFNLSFLPWKKRRGEKGKNSKLQNFLCFIGFGLVLKILVSAEDLCVTWCYSF